MRCVLAVLGCLVAVGTVACRASGGNADAGEPDGGAVDGGALDAGGDASVVHDPYPHPCTYARDLQADGRYDWISKYELDEDGRVTLDETDADGDNDIDYVTVTTYDEDGRQTRQTLDDDNDGMVDVEHVIEYRADGQPELDVDYDGDGEELRRLEYAYDDDGFLIELFGRIPGGDDHSDHPSRVTMENDDNGCMIARVQDDHDDGVDDVSSVYEVDDDCNRLLEETDRQADGTVDLIGTISYDDEGRPLVEEFVENGMLRLLRTTEYEGGLKMSVTEERASSKDVMTFEYDDAGNLLRVEDDPFDDGMAITVTTYENDGRGNPLYVLIDDRGDGHPDDLAAYTYACWQ